MPITMRQVGPCFAAEVDGIDMRKPLSPDEVTAIHEGMNEYAVLVFHDQDIDGEQHLAFTLSLGELEAPTRASLREAAPGSTPSQGVFRPRLLPATEGPLS